MLLTGIVPLMLVGSGGAPSPGLIRRGGLRALPVVRAEPGRRGRDRRRSPARTGRGSWPPWAVTSSHPSGHDTDLHQLQHGAWVTFQAFLELFGANVFNTSFLGTRPALEVVFVSAAPSRCDRRRPAPSAWGIAQDLPLRRADRAGVRRGHRGQPGRLHDQHARAGPARRARDGRGAAARRGAGRPCPRPNRISGLDWRRPRALVCPPFSHVLGAGYLATLGYGAAQASVPAVNEPLASWLVAHGLTDGLATYWQANSTTLDSGGRILLSAVKCGPGGHSRPTSGRPTTRISARLCTTRTSWSRQPLRAARHAVSAELHLRPPAADLSRSTATPS